MNLSPKQVETLLAIAAAHPMPFIVSGWVADCHVHGGLHGLSLRSLVTRGLVVEIACSDGKVSLADKTTIHLAILTREGVAAARERGARHRGLR